jgi:3-oxoadipate enol-lactonase
MYFLGLSISKQTATTSMMIFVYCLMKKLHLFNLLLALIFSLACSNKHQQHAATSNSIKAGNLEVYYERAGEGAPIVLLHAGLQDHTMWDEQVKALSAEYEVIAPDLPFHGKTNGADTTLLAQDVIRILLDSLHLQKTFIAGLSMGASIAQDFAIAYPGRVNKVVLISAGINGYDKTHPIDSISMDWYSKFSDAWKKGDTLKAAIEFTKAWAQGIYRNHDSLRAMVSRYVYRTTFKICGHRSLQNSTS